ncbi:MAG TPA: SGNH/GDSL hydrolase family protein [Microbacteriaceae bacterium]|nr:SGNH/GDSL hydrolase family protein [Microbacteriaceae bacterium]
MPHPHPWTRYVAIGDSFTEGVGDPEPASEGGLRGWADRVAEVLAVDSEDFAYANLAVRGKLLRGIRDEQAEAALALRPDLITVSAGGNDILRPGTDPDEVARRLDELVGLLGRDGATIAVFTGPDIGMRPVMRAIRGKVAIFNQQVHSLARRHDAIVIDLWALTELRDPRMWSEDRLHFSPLGHHTIALYVLDALGIAHELDDAVPPPLPATTWRRARTEDLVWAREHLMPWVLRRLRGRSSGDGRPPKRPDLHPLH